MGATEPGTTIDLTTISRAVASVAVKVIHTVECTLAGETRVRTARGNAWAAICADRERARQHEEIRRMVAALTATGAERGKRAKRQPAV